MNFLFIACAVGRVLTGGDRVFIEIGKRLIQEGHRLIVLTSEQGKEGCQNAGLQAEFWVFDNKERKGLAGALIGLIVKMVKASLYLRKRELKGKTIIYPVSDLIYDVFPALFAKGEEKKLIALYHMIKPSPLEGGYRGYFRKKGISLDWRSLLNYLQDRLSLLCMKLGYHLIIPQSHYNRLFLEKRLPKEKIAPLDLNPGIEWDVISNITPSDKRYDACWMGRYHPQKGIDDLIEIWDFIRKKRKDAKLVLIGDVVEKVSPMVKKYGLEENITFTGFLYGIEKFQVLSQSKIFLIPSYYESWAFVIGEALACGLPVVAYDLPIYRDIYPQGLIRVPIGDKKAFAEEVLRLLDNEIEREKISAEGRRDALRYNWDETAKKFLSLCEEIWRK